MHTRPTEPEIAAIYGWALLHASNAVPRPAEAREGARDSATDAVVWAINNYDPSKGKFGFFAQSVIRRVVKLHMGRMHERRRPMPLSMDASIDGEEVETLHDCVPARENQVRGSQLLPTTINDLPDEMQAAIRFYFVDGYCVRDCAHLLGCSVETVRVRLRSAARLLAPGVKEPRRKNGTKYFARG
jgi:RNA polymerase sigma factor (sigma-70 family)